MTAGHTLGKSGGAAGIHDIGEILISINLDIRRLGRSLTQKLVKTIDIVSSDSTSLGDFIEQVAKNLLPGIEQIGQIGDNYAL